LLRNARLETAAGQSAPDGWTPWQPEWAEARVAITPTRRGVKLTGAASAFAVGGLAQTVTGIKGGQSYAIRVRCQLKGLERPSQTALVRLTWLKGTEPGHVAGVLVRGPDLKGAEATFDDVFAAPEGADGARLSLEVKWPGKGSVTWQEASLRPCAPRAARKARVGTVYLKPSGSTPQRNLDLWCAQVDAAGRQQLDLLCLSEAITMVGTSATVSTEAEPIPGPTTRRLGEAARRNHLWLVAGLMETEAGVLYNTAVLLDRNGNLAGKYRKVHLPREEWHKGIRPGQDYPVFRTDFGVVGLQICYDYFFPENTEILALNGAEIVLAPTWGTTFADQEGRVEGQSIMRVRARDNGVYLVASIYDGESLVIDPMGRILASNQGQTGVFWAEIDLNQREPLWWVGHWGSIGPRDRRPDTYRRLTETAR
jgi:predicted amidohydrolase